MRASRPASRVARVVGPRHPITLTLPPLGLDLGLAPLAVEAVSAGPVWQGGGYWESDGTAYLVCDGTINMTATEWEVVIWYRHVYYAGRYIAAAGVSGNDRAWASIPQAANVTALVGGRFGDGPGPALWSDPIVYHMVIGGTGTSRTAASGSQGAVGAASLASACDLSAPSLRVGYGPGPTADGGRIYAMAMWPRALTSGGGGERALLYGGGAAQVNPLSVASDAPICLDMRLAYDDGGVMVVPNLGTLGQTHRFSQVNGTSARFGVGAFV